jgi:L-fuculose-phosphate aldolase
VVRIPDQTLRDVLHVCRRMYERGLVAGSDGNVSVRISKEHLLATPTGASKGFLEADDLVVCDLAGQQVSGKRRLTTEIKIHLAVYAAREDACAVVHAHPPFATAFAVANQALDEKLMPEAYIAVGKVALTPYGTPSTDELADKIRPALKDHDAVLLANHGAMTWAGDVVAAHHRMEALEQLAKITFLTRQLGSARPLSAEEMAKLEAIRGVYGTARSNVPCYQCGWSPATPAPTEARGEMPRHAVLPRPQGYVAPETHWPGNPPVWERPGGAATMEEAQVRDLARRALQAAQNESSRPHPR